MELSVTLDNISTAFQELEQLGAKSGRAITQALSRIAHLIRGEAIRRAPISPSKKVIQGTLYWSKRGGATHRRIARTTKRNPGGLEHSIQCRSDSQKAEVYVPANAAAGKYAFRIHEEKGISWNKRGLGTVAKGPLADAKFITRAVTDNVGKIISIIQNEHEKATGVTPQ